MLLWIHVTKRNDDINVVLSPMAWQPSANGKRWYFTANVSKKGEWFSVQIEDPHYEPPARISDVLRAVCASVIELREIDARSMFTLALSKKEPIVVHDCDDELEALRLCEHLWQGLRK